MTDLIDKTFVRVNTCDVVELIPGVAEAFIATDVIGTGSEASADGGEFDTLINV